MNKYKLINKQTGEEHLCEKVVLGGFDYYVSDENVSGKIAYNPNTNRLEFFASHPKYDEGGKEVIATNNPNIDVPKVVDEIELLGNVFSNGFQLLIPLTQVKCLNQGFQAGYNKSQETHPFSEEDVIEFGYWLLNDEDRPPFTHQSKKELLKIWKEQRTKTLYYE